MNYLLDTHALLWATANMPELSPMARDLIADNSNTILASIVSAWEINIKVSLGKLTAPANLVEAIDACGFERRLVSFYDAAALRALPHHHGDPFDRLLIVQAMRAGWTIITRDRVFQRYDVATAW
jgi:PIN domain nuclease of toxin-antitoxin system